MRKPRGLRLIPWALFGNADDPFPPAEYLPGKPEMRRRISWWFRNPFHNLMFYVIGCVDRPAVSTGRDPSVVFILPRGVNWAVTRANKTGWPRPFVSFAGKWLRGYAGWRPPEGAFGLKLQRNRD